jgi:hypothetical protein
MSNINNIEEYAEQIKKTFLDNYQEKYRMKSV